VQSREPEDSLAAGKTHGALCSFALYFGIACIKYVYTMTI